MLRRLFCCLLPLVALAGCSPVVEDTRPGQPVKQRQDAFKAVLRSFEPMGLMLRDKRYDPEAFAHLAAELASRRDAPWAHFGPDTNYPPTKAKEAVWSRPDEFAREREQFVAVTDALLAAAQTRELGAVQAAYEQVHASCKSCHRVFKR